MPGHNNWAQPDQTNRQVGTTLFNGLPDPNQPKFAPLSMTSTKPQATIQKVPTKGLYKNNRWYCNCDPRLPAENFECRNGGNNHGRWFYTCQHDNIKTKRCGFFLWHSDASLREEAVLLSGSRTESAKSEEMRVRMARCKGGKEIMEAARRIDMGEALSYGNKFERQKETKKDPEPVPARPSVYRTARERSENLYKAQKKSERQANIQRAAEERYEKDPKLQKARDVAREALAGVQYPQLPAEDSTKIDSKLHSVSPSKRRRSKAESQHEDAREYPPSSQTAAEDSPTDHNPERPRKARKTAPQTSPSKPMTYAIGESDHPWSIAASETNLKERAFRTPQSDRSVDIWDYARPEPETPSKSGPSGQSRADVSLQKPGYVRRTSGKPARLRDQLDVTLQKEVLHILCMADLHVPEETKEKIDEVISRFENRADGVLSGRDFTREKLREKTAELERVREEFGKLKKERDALASRNATLSGELVIERRQYGVLKTMGIVKHR